MIDYSDLISGMVNTIAPSIIVFLMLAIVLDYLRTMVFANPR